VFVRFSDPHLTFPIFPVFFAFQLSSSLSSSKMAAVAHAVAFRTALGRIGFNANTQLALEQNGFSTIMDLTTVHESDLDQLPKHLGAWRDADLAPEDQVRVPFVSLKKLKAMRYWVLSQRFLGHATPSATEFTNDVLEATLLRMQADDDYKAATSEAQVQKPVALTDLAKWTKFWELFMTYLSRVKGVANTPLSYLVREHAEVTADIAAAEYANSVDRLVATTVLQGAHFDLDNRTLYDALKPLVVDGPGWAFVRRFDKQKDGRGAVLALKGQAEGPAAELTRKAKAYASILTAVYRGPRRGFSFANYVTVHQEAHNELQDLAEPVAEHKKVRDFLKGIQDPALQVGKTVVLSDPNKLADFEECQQYLSTLVESTAVQAKTERNVSSVHTGGGERSPNAALIDKIKGGQYSSEQFRSLTKEEKDRVARYREKVGKKGGKRRGKKQENKKRRASKAESEQVEPDPEEKPEEDTNADRGAGAQFGGNGNRNKKSKK
jgi:hypothetical protein